MRELDPVAAICCAGADERPSLRVPDAAREVARRRFAALGLAHRRWVLLHPSATGRVTPLSGRALHRGRARLPAPSAATGVTADAPVVDAVMRGLRDAAQAVPSAHPSSISTR
jgi:hypothetical protein